MPAQHYPRRGGLRRPSPRRPGAVLPGIGGYDMPRGPYGEGGFPGSTPAAPPTHTQEAPEGARGTLQLSASEAQQEWRTLPRRRRSGMPQQPYARGRPDLDQAQFNLEGRWSPPINRRPPGDQRQRNTVYYGGQLAAPGQMRAYLSAPNPGKNGGRPARDRSAGFDNDAGAVVGGVPTTVYVDSRYVAVPDQDGYAVQRPIPLKVHAVPHWYRGDVHLRGAILDGERYTGAVEDQQMDHGEGTGAYGIARARGPLHRPVRFERPPRWTAHYYDVAPEQGATAPDMIYQSPGPPPGRRTSGRANTRRRRS